MKPRIREALNKAGTVIIISGLWVLAFGAFRYYYQQLQIPPYFFAGILLTVSGFLLLGEGD